MKLKHTKKSWYRPDIDGLRALAIIPVVLFHAGIAGFSGGFVGVDIFFVISGFLITSIIYREMQKGTFSILTFWERRMRRIIPALFVVIMTSMIAGYFIILFPVDYIDLAQSAFAQSLFLANLFFMRKNSYFAGPSEGMPLLHTWSLSVEEQFYIGFPILMFIIWRFGRRAVLAILVLLAGASLAYAAYLLAHPTAGFSLPGVPNVWGGALNENAAFYLIFSRAFELAIGAVLAVGAYKISKQSLKEGLALIGLAAIVYSIVFFTEETAFPGLNALFPTLGTALIIVANTDRQTFVGNLLSFPLFVWIGLISYSLYLWHWPLLALGRYHLNRMELTQYETMLLVLLSFVLAYLTYRFVETPFREKRLLARRTYMLIGGLIGLVTMAASGYYVMEKNGLPERAPAEARAIADATVDFYERRGECFVNSFAKGKEPCLLGTQTKPVDFVLWGDSHAAALLPMIENEAKKYEKSGAAFIVEGCTPITDLPRNRQTVKCENVRDLARAYIEKHDVKKILLVARWNAVYQINTEDEAITSLPIEQNVPEKTLQESAFSYYMEDMLAELQIQNVEVYLVKQAPVQQDFEIGKLFMSAVRNPENVEFTDVSYDAYLAYHKFINEYFDSLETQGLAHTIDPADVLCDTKSVCVLSYDGKLIYRDGDHLNQTGANFVAPAFTEFFSEE